MKYERAGNKLQKILEVKNLKTYFKTSLGAAKAVDNVCFEIKKGETFAIVGESGSGKSVTALSIMQLLPEAGFIEGGEVIVDGKNILTLPEVEKRGIRGNIISMIFQEPMTSLNPVFTIGEQIIEAIVLHQKISKAKARDMAIDMLRKVQLPSPEKSIDKYPHTLSGGQLQRVMIAIALVCEPSLLIADEPTTALDVTIQKEILALINKLREELSTAVMLITHNLALVSENADTVAVMYGGKIVEKTSTKRLFKDPLHPYTVSLMRSVPDSRNLHELQSIPGTVPEPTAFPAGCRFSGRCEKEMIGCAEVLPELIEVKEGHHAACHLYDSGFMQSDKAAPLRAAIKTSTALSKQLPSDSDEIMLELKDMHCHYPIKRGIFKRTVGYVRAVDGISLKLKKGRTLALVGESGCGKTTAAKAILRLLSLSSGNILIKDTDISNLSESNLRAQRSVMQIIFQDPYSSLNPRMTVADIIDEGLKSLKPELSKSSREEKTNMALEMVGLSKDMKERFPHEFSGGQRQRIGIARVLAIEPELIVCDEATSALDVSVQAQILNLLKDVQVKHGLSFLFITHDLGVVRYIADEVAVMKDGKIIEMGKTEDVFSSPKEKYTRELLSAVPRIE